MAPESSSGPIPWLEALRSIKDVTVVEAEFVEEEPAPPLPLEHSVPTRAAIAAYTEVASDNYGRTHTLDIAA